MARNLNPQCKQCRREGDKLFLRGERCLSSKCAIVKRNFPPGMHAPKGKPKLSGYGMQLREKQKAKKIYGLLERQFSNYYKKATKKEGNTAEIFMQLLETRMDNVVFRAGFASSRQLARQLVNHGHFQVNGKRCDIPSCQLKAGEKITVKNSALKKKYWQELLKTIENKEAPGWLVVDKKGLSITVKALPMQQDLKQSIAMNLIIEYYSR
jgi:small subunit ribosomal protein S4